MTHINEIKFKTVLIDGTERILNVLTYSRENFSMYFSLQSVAQSINELLLIYGANEIFHTEFYERWNDDKLQCMTEFEVQLLIPINLIMEPSTEQYNPMPVSLVHARYLNDRYQESIMQYCNHVLDLNDIFCIAEKQGFTESSDVYYHKFTNAIGFLSLISILKLRYIRVLYKTFFLVEMLNSADIEYIYDTLLVNRKRVQPDDIANVFQLNADEIRIRPLDLRMDAKILYVNRFNKMCKIFKSFAFNIMDEQSQYVSRNLQVVTQFGMDRQTVERVFSQIPKLDIQHITAATPRYTPEQIELLCRDPGIMAMSPNLTEIEINILYSFIKIHIMINRMTKSKLQRQDLEFYRKLLQTRFSVNLEELITDMDVESDRDDITRSYETGDKRLCLVKNYTIGEIIGEFIKLYVCAQQNVNTIWLCKFIVMSCNPQYSNLINIMADFVPFFQRFFTNDFNVNSINNVIIFLQGMCRPDEDSLKSLNGSKGLKQMDVKHFRSFSLSCYQAVNANPLVTFLDLVLTNGNSQNRYTINLNSLNDYERNALLDLINPDEQKFIDYVYDLVVGDDECDDDINTTEDLTGEKRFNFQQIDYNNIIPIVSTNTFNENNTTMSSLQLFNNTMNQAIFFHELTNRVTYKVPGVVCNVIVK